MKRFLLLFCFLFIPLQVLAVSNLKLNGSSQHTITSLPTEIVMTCDLAQAGNQVEAEMYIDVNNSATLDNNDLLLNFLILTDGIGWIRDPENPDDDIPGDETSVDGKLKTTFPFEEDDVLILSGQFIVKLTDQDASTATALLLTDIQPQPPYITGKVSDAGTGTPIPGVFIMAMGDVGEEYPETSFGISDTNGDYFVNINPGIWKLVAVTAFTQSEYMSSDTATVTVVAGETKTQNFQLQKYDSFVEGTTKKEDDSPVPEITIMAYNTSSYKASMGTSDETGYYKLGVDPGEVDVSVNMFLNMSSWPEGYYADPASDTVTVPSGQTVTVDFVFKPYTSFIEGDCKVGSEGLAGVTITAMTIDFQSGAFDMSSTLSDDQGHYRIGVMPGMVSSLTATKEGYSSDSGYFGITIAAGETITGKDFTFTQGSGEMSISGQATYDNSNPANNVYVVAILDEEDSPAGYRIAYTDGSGNYQFDGLMEGYWQVGVYQAGYESTPPMFYDYITSGTVITDADFVLSAGTGVALDNSKIAPKKFYLAQNYPNPFKLGMSSTTTNIQFSLDRTTRTEIAVYNISGQLVRRLHASVLNMGLHHFEWDGRNEAGSIVPTGVYFYRITAGERNITRRMLIVK